jgi:NAD-dependent deacetylase
VIVNPEATPLDAVAELCLREPAALCLPLLLA